MTLIDCKGCIHLQSMIGIGQGVRCSAPENNIFSKSENNMPPLISWVPYNCKYKKEK